MQAGPDFTKPAGPVEVRRDEWGTPHISAVDANDALFVLGYETARDRMFQLDLLRRRTLGRTAELLGESADDDDRIARTLGFGRLGHGHRDRPAQERPRGARRRARRSLSRLRRPFGRGLQRVGDEAHQHVVRVAEDHSQRTAALG